MILLAEILVITLLSLLVLLDLTYIAVVGIYVIKQLKGYKK